MPIERAADSQPGGKDASASQLAASQSGTLNVLVLLVDGFDDAEAAIAADVLGWAGSAGAGYPVSFDIRCLGKDARGAFGARYAADAIADDCPIDAYDALVVPGVAHAERLADAEPQRAARLAERFHAAGRTVVSMAAPVRPSERSGAAARNLPACEVASAEAESGESGPNGFADPFGFERTSEHLLDWDGVISCSGPHFAEQAMYDLLDHLLGDEAVARVERLRCGAGLPDRA